MQIDWTKMHKFNLPNTPKQLSNNSNTQKYQFQGLNDPWNMYFGQRNCGAVLNKIGKTASANFCSESKQMRS